MTITATCGQSTPLFVLKRQLFDHDILLAVEVRSNRLFPQMTCNGLSNVVGRFETTASGVWKWFCDAPFPSRAFLYSFLELRLVFDGLETLCRNRLECSPINLPDVASATVTFYGLQWMCIDNFLPFETKRIGPWTRNFGSFWGRWSNEGKLRCDWHLAFFPPEEEDASDLQSIKDSIETLGLSKKTKLVR